MKHLRWLRQSMHNIKSIVFSKKATYRLAKITDFIYNQSQSELINYKMSLKQNGQKQKEEPFQ